MSAHGVLTPNELCRRFDLAIADDEASGLTPNDVPGIVFDIIADVIDSARLAAYEAVLKLLTPEMGPGDPMLGIADCVAEEVLLTVNDYVGNHYGEL